MCNRLLPKEQYWAYKEAISWPGVLVLIVAKDFISKCKAEDQLVNQLYKKLHQPARLELKTLLLLTRYSASLSVLKTSKQWKCLTL